MNTFPPKPGTVAYRVLAHLETILPRRPRATVGMIAGELRGLTPSQVRDACEAAHEAGYLTRSFEDSGIGRGPVFYELVRGTTGTPAVSAARGFDDAEESGPEPAAGGVIEPVVDPHPPVAEAPILSEHATAPPAALAQVVNIRRVAPGQSEDVDLPPLGDWLRAAHGVPLERAVVPAPAQVPELAPPVETAVFPPDVKLDFAAGTDGFAVALSSDGRLHCWRGVVPYVFSRLEVQQLVAYLNRVDLDDLLADAP